MKVYPLRNTARGEQILGVEPPIAPQVRPSWLRRLNYYSGRSLSAGALEIEQNGRAGQIALGGQLIAPGIVTGFNAALEQDAPPIDAPPDIEPVSDYYVHIGAGTGVAVNGEDVVLPQDLRVWLDDVLVIDRISTLGGSPPDVVEPGALSPRTMGPPFWQFRTELELPATYPRAGILVLQPVELEVVGDGDPSDPCEQDPENYSYEDWQRVDGFQLALYIWPGDWRLLPVRGSAWRNRIANTIFQAEMELGPDEALPWELEGLPIALIGFTDDWLPEFIDRFAVARIGGQGQRRPAFASSVGNPFLFRARIEQFTEHINELGDVPVDQLNQAFNYVPPVGFLPTDILNFIEQENLFFPPSYDISMRPIPLEQLDLVMKHSAGLQAFDMNAPDQVELLVPVPQAVYEPRLLVHEIIAPEFDAAIARYVSQRGAVLDRRANVRDKANAVALALRAADRDFGQDPDTQADEVDYVPPVILGAHRSTAYDATHQHFFIATTDTLTLAAGDLLAVYIYIDPENVPQEAMLQWHTGDPASWEHRAYWGADRINWGVSGTASRFNMGDLPPVGEWLELSVRAEDVDLVGATIDGMAFTLFGGRAAWAMGGVYSGGERSNWYETAIPAGATEGILNETWQWVAANNLLAPLEEAFSTALVGDPETLEPVALTTLRNYLDGTRLRPSDPEAPGAVDDVAPLDERGLEAYIDFLKDKIDRADDKINIGFLRVHTDIYRVRQIMLGNTAGTQLAISPALAEIAKADTAAASREQINSFYTELKGAAAAAQTFQASAAVAPSGTGTPAAGAAPSFSSFALNTLDLGTSLGGSIGTGLQTNFPVGTGLQTNLPGGTSIPVASPTAGPVLEIGGNVSVIPKDTGLIFNFDDATASEIIRKSTESSLVGGTVYSPIDIDGQSPIIGKPVIRSTSIAERLDNPKAPEAKDFSASSKQDVYSDIAQLDLSLEGMQVPGAWQRNEDGSITRGVATNIAAFRDPTALGGLLVGIDPDVDDEAGHFANTVDLMDNAIATLRIFEGRVQIYKAALARAQKTLAELQALEKQILARLRVIGRDLAEARHDVAVARALRAEEQDRLDTINERRLQVINENVPFIAYQRPRVADTLKETPVRALVPGILEAAVPACLRQRILVPKEIRAVVELLRDVPVRFFTYLPQIVDRLDQPHYFYDVLDTALVRAQVSPAIVAPTASSSRFGQSINTVFASQQQVVTQYRAQVANTAALVQPTTSWQQLRDLSIDRLSLADFINSRHGKSDVDNQMTQELDNIARVAACLHESFSGILPVLRLEWADDISQFDAPINLRNLSSLPRWNEIDYIERREMQSHVDWLFGRVNPRFGDALSIINDLVRVALLLASDAPVDQLIAGKLRKPVTVKPGSSIKLDADISKVFVGMPVMLYQGSQLAARATVQDIDSAGVAATITETLSATVDLAQATTQVHFTASQAITQQVSALPFKSWL